MPQNRSRKRDISLAARVRRSATKTASTRAISSSVGLVDESWLPGLSLLLREPLALILSSPEGWFAPRFQVGHEVESGVPNRKEVE